MKKFMLSLFFMVGIFMLVSQGEMLWSNRLLLDEARVHKIQKNESLSLLAKRYYGNPQRWRELALINRAPNPNLVLPGEEILVPAVGSINEVSRARTITRVNSVVDEQERLAISETTEAARQFSGEAPTAPTAAPAPESQLTTPAGDGIASNGLTDDIAAQPEPLEETPITDERDESAGFPWFWLVVGVMLIGGIFAFMSHRKKTAEQNSDGNETTQTRSDDLFRDRRRHTEGAPSHA